MATTAVRISPRELKKKLERGDNSTLFVCAYEDEEQCREHSLPGALTLEELQAKMPLSKQQEIVFYCA